MNVPLSVKALEDLGRVRLSNSFFMRDFLYSEISNFYGVRNIPDHPDLAISMGKRLCEELLEPLVSTFGRIAIRSAYRSPQVNALGNEKGLNCGSNEKNYGAHIWDYPDKQGHHGAMACILVPWFTDRYEAGADWRALAYWINNHLPYSQLEFFPRLCAFNIGWHEQPQLAIYSYIEPRGVLLNGEPSKPEFAHYYEGFPKFKEGSSNL